MKNSTLPAVLGEDDNFISITLIRALAISAVIMENYFTALPWHVELSIFDVIVSLLAEVSGTFVQVFFVLSGYGLTLSYLKEAPPSWSAWARHRFLRILIPYWIAVIATFALANLLRYWAPDGGHAAYSWTTLLAYLTFLRNFYSPGWALNTTFWFMPVIIGLYAMFPLLIRVMQRWGLAALVAIALLVANGSIMACVYWGYPMEHQNTIPLFFVDEFAAGMVLARFANDHPGFIRRLMGPRYFFLGIGFYALSAAITKFQLLGEGSSTYNDIFTAVGLYLLLLSVCRGISLIFSPGVLKLLSNVSRNSYIMYLIHGPIMYYILKPYAGAYFSTGVSALPMVLSACVFVMLLYVLVEGTALLVRRATAA